MAPTIIYKRRGIPGDLVTVSDTVSSTWSDDGTDSLTEGDSLAAETDSYNWASFNSDSLGATGTQTLNNTYTSTGTAVETAVYSSWDEECVSDGDTGCDTLSADATDSGSLTLAAATASFTIAGSLDYGETIGADWIFQTYVDGRG